MRLLEDGTIIRETYEVERFLGEGAFAEVYRVKHRFLGRQAMKVFKRVGMKLEDIHETLGEAILLSRLGHPNIIRVFEANVTDSERGVCGYFTMENVPGGSLEKFWHSHGARLVPLGTTLDLMKQVCRGIAVAHRESPPIIHRDIKPQNILVGYEADGLRARVGDFGLAKAVNPLTLLATGAGTLSFKPPEVFFRQKSDSCAADVWALGVTLYLLLTDRVPYPSMNGESWELTERFEQAFPPPSEIHPDCDAALDRIVSRALHHQPEDRYATAGELLDELEAWRPAQAAPDQALPPRAGSESKTVLNLHPAGTGRSAEELVDHALEARRAGHLAEAADLMEEAFGQSRALRARYAPQVRLWRCGISM